MGDKERKMRLNELMGKLGDTHVGAAYRTTLEAEYERRKFIWQKTAVIVAIIGLVIATVGVAVGALHLLRSM